MSSTMRAWTLHGLPEMVSELGGDADRVLARFHLSRKQLEREEAILPSATFIQVLEFCSRELDCPDFGLRLGFQLGPEALGPVVMMARHCESAAEAAMAIVNYLHVYIPAVRLQFEPLNAQAERLLFTVIEPRVGSTRQFLEWCMGVSLRNIRLLVGDTAKPYSICFSHPSLLPVNHYRRFFGCKVYFEEAFTSLDLRKRDLQTPLAENDPKLKQLLSEYIEKSAIAGDASLEDQLRSTIKTLLPTGRCKIKVIADQYAMSLRTLQRQLNRNGLNFSDLIEDVRREQLQVYLQEPSLQLTQIAALLGYREQSSLTHACQRWYGESPANLRRRF